MITDEMRRAIRSAYREGHLEVRAVSPTSGEVGTHVVADVMRHEVPHKRAFRVTADHDVEVVATEDHSLFMRTENGIREIQTGEVCCGDELAAVVAGDVTGARVQSIAEVPAHQYMYDLSVPGPENFVLANGIVAHNSYSIGGISLDIDKSSKYESLKQNAEGQFDKATEAKSRTVKFIRGLKQPKFGFGVRSSFGPNVGRGVLSPRSFVAIAFLLLSQGFLV